MQIQHPQKKNRVLNYSGLYGQENSIFLRGRVSGKNEIFLPTYWENLVKEESISVHLTPIGAHQDVIIKRIGQNKIWLQSKGGFPIDCFYLIIGERADVPKLELEQTS